jgi:hypothetical protein
MSRRFQFSLGRLMVATLLTAIGFALFLRSEGMDPMLWKFPFFVSTGWAAFGAAVGVVLGKTRRWTAYGAAIGILITIVATYGEEVARVISALPQPLRRLLSPW